jgi:DNA-binding transcriptional ArsR family regulator
MASTPEPAGPFEELDRLVHDPARLMICTALLKCASADFVFLRRVTGLTAGNLSFHLSRLEEAGLVNVERKIIGRTTRTDVALTEPGRARVATHWRNLQLLLRDTGISTHE